MNLGSTPEWITGIRSKLDYGWRHGSEHGILPDHSIVLDGYSFDVEEILCSKGLGETAFERCIQCGTCSATCPSTSIPDSTIPARRMLHEAQLGLSRFESADIWHCTTCGSCTKQCPRGVDIAAFMTVLRRVSLETGVSTIPPSLQWSLTSIAATGNPLGQPPEKRGDWATGLGIHSFRSGMEVLYFPGCVPSYDPRAIQVAKATARLMQMAGVTFGIMGSKEMCCGETARRVGKRDLFVRLAEHNTRLFEESGASKIVVSSPHCLHAFKNEYPLAGLNVEVLHISQFLLELIAMGRLKVHEVVPHRVTYQDPCYLGRYNNVYDEPREVLRSIPGVELTEMSHHGPGSVCCGGGGGRMWIETRKGERLADIRIEQAKATGADTLVTSCPFCLSMLEDALLTSSAADSMVAKDISELLYEAIDTDTALASRGLPA